MNAFQAGFKCPVAFAASGGQSVVLPITSHSLDSMVALFDVTQTSHGGFTARIAGKHDTSGTVNYAVDADQLIFNAPPNIREGTRGVMLFYITPTQPVQVPIIVEKLHFESAVGSEVKGSFECKENILAGVFVYPTTTGT